MEKLEYQEKKEQIRISLDTLRDEMIVLKQKYIDENKKFNIGQKVTIIANKDIEHVGFVSKIVIGWRDVIEYKFFKCKKDGKPSKHELWLWKIISIKPIKL